VRHARRAGPREHRVTIGVERGIAKMAVAID